MQTLYIDIYFLINFTVDILALYFSSGFAKIPVSVPRLIIAAIFGGGYAVFAILFISTPKIMYPISFILLSLMVVICTPGVSVYRKIKYAAAFFLFQIIIGGFVYYSYCTLDKVINPSSLSKIGAENRNLLILSLIILLSIGVLKLIILFFGSVRSEKNARLAIEYNGHEIKLEALVDSGNLARDPFDKTPVMLINKKTASEIFGEAISASDDISKFDYSIRSKIRVIPIKRGNINKILYGIKPDSAYVLSGDRRERIAVVLAIDCDEENYGGYPGLIPLTALEDVIYDSN